MSKMWIVYSPSLDLNFFDKYEDALKEYEDTKSYLLSEGVEEGEQVFLLESVKAATVLVDEEKMKLDGAPKENGFDYDFWAKWEEE